MGQNIKGNWFFDISLIVPPVKHQFIAKANSKASGCMICGKDAMVELMYELENIQTVERYCAIRVKVFQPDNEPKTEHVI